MVIGNNLADLIHHLFLKLELLHNLPGNRRALYLLVIAGGAFVFLLGFMYPDIVKDSRGHHHQGVSLFFFQERFGITQDLPGVIYPAGVFAEIALHLKKQEVFLSLVLIRDTCTLGRLNQLLIARLSDALYRFRAPQGAAKIHIRINHLLLAVKTLALRLILKKLNYLFAIRAGYLAGVLRLPILGILPRAFIFAHTFT